MVFAFEEGKDQQVANHQKVFQKYPVIFAVILVLLLSYATYIPLNVPFGKVFLRILLCVILIVYLQKNKLERVLKFSVTGVKRSLLSGIFFLLFGIWVAFNNIMFYADQFYLSVAFWEFCFQMLMIGIFEELCWRGVILNVYMKHREQTRSTIYKAVLLSSLLFGIAHFTNLITGQGFIITAVQAISATFVAVLFAAVYLKGMNIWVCGFLHGLWDFANLYGSFLPTTDRTGGMTEKISLSQAAMMLIEPVVFLLIGIFILRNIHKEKYMNLIFTTS